MLPPSQARGGLIAGRRGMMSTALQTRSISSKWTARSNYTSHLDPLFQRFTRFRTMKTRAKLLEKLKRRGRFEWDLNARPFFTPRHMHIREASHFNGSGRGRWPTYRPDGSREDGTVEVGKPGEEGHELSQREKEWKERMEAMRKQIERDPYQAVFGRRFEPFWSPLVLGWMREEMGWPKKQQEGSSGTKTAWEEQRERNRAMVDAIRKQQIAGVVVKPTDATPKAAAPKPAPKPTVEPKVVDVTPKPTNQAPAYSASYSSTSWDSWTQKTKRTEWDSNTGQVQRFEYDPVSNRMVAIPPPQAATARPSPEPVKITVVKNDTPSAVELRKAYDVELKRANDMRSLINSPPFKSNDNVEIPIRKSFAVTSDIDSLKAALLQRTDEEVTQTMQRTDEEVKAAQWTPSTLSSRSAAASTSNPTTAPQDSQSKINVTVNMSTAKPQETSKAQNPAMVDRLADLRAALEQRIAPSSSSPAKPAKLASLPANDLDFLTADDVRARMGKLKEQHGVKPLTPTEKAALETKYEISVAEWDKAEDAVIRERELERSNVRARLQTSVDRKARDKHENTEAVTEKLSELRLQPSLQRMMTKDAPSGSAAADADLDDAAAHESTETVELPTKPSSGVPKGWNQAAEILQANRILRTMPKRSLPQLKQRWMDDMEAKKAAYEAATAPSAAQQIAAGVRAQKLAKANALLEAEVMEQKGRMLEHEARAASLPKREVEDMTAMESMEQANACMAELEQQLSEMQAHEGKYTRKIRSLREEVDRAYKQSAVHNGKHVERIEFLKAELDKRSQATSEKVEAVQQSAGGASTTNADDVIPQGEGCLAPGVVSFADNGRWYKRPAVSSSTASNQEIAKAEQKARDQKLVKDVREVYEREYGVIDARHRQSVASDARPKKQAQPTQVVEVESDVDLGEALAEHEKRSAYGFKDNGLEREIQAKEKEAHEAQALMQPERAEKMKGVVAESLKPALEAAPESVPAVEKSLKPTAQWEEPPVYKILAYDSGNDMFSTATTTANFTDNETPISIPQALSQLYQPARFVPHFAALQQEGWQVIHGTADLLVFKKVAKVVKPEEVKPVDDVSSLVDHGVITPKENALAQEAANFYDLYKPAPKEYDPTSIENGKLMPYENAMAQEAAHAYDAAVARSTAVNPIDGMAKTSAQPEVSTGHYASPTGFVNHDRSFLDDVSSAKIKEAMNKKETASFAQDVDSPQSSRPMRRQEHVFSGTQRADSQSQRSLSDRHKRHLRREETRRSGRRRDRRGGAVKWALGVGVGAAGVAYAVGVAAEYARQERKEKERWREIVEGRRLRWE
ncbi:hypothetical protein LTR56_023493 [Elasticomyces elasticus]|nr:hypothetical protein LTR56_023493 [Elasticomyces elasticus]KAK3662827.1 hypothetical protein LTR22_006445 [Elasticomyces elasticus]KAK4911875.1 hypothetical protein LTR49_019590 [Elasticomyces elasticus]KAK5765664.1 hypothetical protein LTS12_004170 [Elasticomyces elasticus]